MSPVIISIFCLKCRKHTRAYHLKLPRCRIYEGRKDDDMLVAVVKVPLCGYKVNRHRPCIANLPCIYMRNELNLFSIHLSPLTEPKTPSVHRTTSSAATLRSGVLRLPTLVEVDYHSELALGGVTGFKSLAVCVMRGNGTRLFLSLGANSSYNNTASLHIRGKRHEVKTQQSPSVDTFEQRSFERYYEVLT